MNLCNCNTCPGCKAHARQKELSQMATSLLKKKCVSNPEKHQEAMKYHLEIRKNLREGCENAKNYQTAIDILSKTKGAKDVIAALNERIDTILNEAAGVLDYASDKVIKTLIGNYYEN